MSLRSKLWVTVGLLCASMAARAEYKEVWNPPEAKHDAQQAARSKHAAAVSKAANVAHPGAHASHVQKPGTKQVVRSGSKPKARQARGAVVKTAHLPVASKPLRKSVSTQPPTPADTAAVRSAPMVDTRAPQPGNAQASRELPPILH